MKERGLEQFNPSLYITGIGESEKKTEKSEITIFQLFGIGDIYAESFQDSQQGRNGIFRQLL